MKRYGRRYVNGVMRAVQYFEFTCSIYVKAIYVFKAISYRLYVCLQRLKRKNRDRAVFICHVNGA